MQIRFENYSVSAFPDLSPQNKDMEKLKHALSHMKFSYTDSLSDRQQQGGKEGGWDDYDNEKK